MDQLPEYADVLKAAEEYADAAVLMAGAAKPTAAWAALEEAVQRYALAVSDARLADVHARFEAYVVAHPATRFGVAPDADPTGAAASAARAKEKADNAAWDIARGAMYDASLRRPPHGA